MFCTRPSLHQNTSSIKYVSLKTRQIWNPPEKEQKKSLYRKEDPIFLSLKSSHIAVMCGYIFPWSKRKFFSSGKNLDFCP
jgi:hypothetical protein